MRKIITLALVLGVSTFTACDKSAAGTGAAPSAASPTRTAAPAAAKVASCDSIKSESMCREYGEKTVEAAGLESLKGFCAGGVFKAEPCPSEKRIGACVTPEGTKISYSVGGYPSKPAKAAKACAEGVPAGEWKSGA